MLCTMTINENVISEYLRGVFNFNIVLTDKILMKFV